MTLLGEKGLRQLARINHETACDLADRLTSVPGVELLTDTFFNEFSLKLPKSAAGVVDALVQKGVLGGVPASRLFPGAMDDVLIVAATETNTEADLSAFADALKEVL